MKIIPIGNIDAFQKCKKLAIDRVRFEAHEAAALYLRRQFEFACTEPTATATILIAQEMGLTDLAEEMKADFYSENGREIAS